MRFAGLYEEWTPPDSDAKTTFAILTCTANSTMAAVHDRMPEMLSDRDADDWVNPRAADPLVLKRILNPAAEDLLEMAVAPAAGE
jgi:putative SOS response-associated peptidase YedK